MTRLEVDHEHIVAVLKMMFLPGEVVEVRVPSVQRAGTASGYFDDFHLAARAAAKYNARVPGIYFTLNPVNRVLLARSANRMIEWAKTVTSDSDIVARRFMLLDFDPVRPSGISSSEAELAAALERRDAVKAWLQETGQFPPGLTGLSGNGGHLLYRLPDLPNTQETTDLVRACIVAVKSRFGDDVVSVDDTVFNASRLTKLYGTWARKGDNLPERPHRLSHLDLPSTSAQPVSLDLLHWLANQVTPSAPGAPGRATGPRPLAAGRRLDVAAYLAASGREYRVRQKHNVTWYNFLDCPVHTDPDGDHYECGICQFENGALGAACQHDPQATWADFKAVLGDPGPYYIGGDAGYITSIDKPAPATVPPVLPTYMPGEQASDREITLDQVLTYARCPMEHLLRYQLKVPALPTGQDAIQQTVRLALRDFHSGAKPSVLVAAQAAWRVLLGEWQVDNLNNAYAALENYALLRAELLLPFFQGEIVKPDGSRYRNPRASRVYQQRAQARGLLNLQAVVDEQIPHPRLSLRSDELLAEVFADSLEIAARCRKPAVDDAAAPGVQVPFRLDLPGNYGLSGWADLLACVQEHGRPGMVAVLYDFSDHPEPGEILAHDLRVLALLNAGDEFWRGPALAGGSESSRIVKVHYLRTGGTVSVYGSASPAWGRALLSAVVRAVNTPGVPRMAFAPGQCGGCAYYDVCASVQGWDILVRTTGG